MIAEHFFIHRAFQKVIISDHFSYKGLFQTLTITDHFINSEALRIKKKHLLILHQMKAQYTLAWVDFLPALQVGVFFGSEKVKIVIAVLSKY